MSFPDHATILDGWAYTIQETSPFTINVFNANNPHPEGWAVLDQPHNPDTGVDWASYKEAEEWVIAQIQTHYNADHIPSPETAETIQAQIHALQNRLDAYKAQKAGEEPAPTLPVDEKAQADFIESGETKSAPSSSTDS